MLILWIRKYQTDNTENPARRDNDTFNKHNEDMKNFRKAHPDKEPADTVEFVTPDGGLLASVVNAKLGDNAQN